MSYELDGSQDHLIPFDCTPISAEEIQRRIDEKDAEFFASLSYKIKRENAYPSFEDQFDLLYHGGYDAWKAAIDAVKKQYPKE